MSETRFRSVCSGIEAASVAWAPLGWRCVELAEIEPFPCAVLEHHYPEVPNAGDFTSIRKRPRRQIAPADVLVGGTPCQSFSVAGLRKGMGDERGQLAIEFLRLADATRPRWVVWENVPRVLSSGGGRDFGSFLGGLGELGYGWAYRVLDAQYLGVPQRRRRVFVVGHLGDWRRAAAVLFERHSLSGDPPPGREAGSVVAGTLASRTGAGGGLGTDFDLSGGLVARAFNEVGHAEWNEGIGTLRASHAADGYCGLIASILPASDGGVSSGYHPVIPVQAYQYHGSNVGPMGTLRAGNGNETGGVPFIVNAAESCARESHARQSDTARCLDQTGGFAANQGGTVVAVPFDTTQITSAANYSNPRAGDPCHPLAAGAHPPAIAFHANQDPISGEISPCLPTHHGNIGVLWKWAVRRLTPLECERLQGFPDNWTLVPFRGKSAADGPRYKAIGNSIAVPVLRWIGERIMLVDRLVGEVAA